MIEKAVIDRFEEEYAILLIGDGNWKLDIPRWELPEGVKEGTWLKVDVEEGTLVTIEIDIEAGDQAKARIMDKLARLRQGKHRAAR
jgi:hypothetical protein